MSLCLAAGTVTVVLLSEAFTLAWTHTIEKLRWEEDWRVVGDHLVIEEARIRGAGAGMEPPAGARLERGVWRYRPTLPPQPELRLALTTQGEFELCLSRECHPLSALLSVQDTLPTMARLWPCSGALPQ